MSETRRAHPAALADERQWQLAARLREAREYLGLSRQFIAEQTGIPGVAISAIENGKRKLEALELEALARLYTYPITYFLEGALETPPTVRAARQHRIEERRPPCAGSAAG